LIAEYGKSDVFKLFLKAKQSRSARLIDKLINPGSSESISRDVSVTKSIEKSNHQKVEKESTKIVKSIKKRFRKTR